MVIALAMTCPTGVSDACPRALAGASSNVFLSLVNTLMTTQCILNPRQTYPDPYTFTDKTFDFVIIGAGSAGCVVANRLSENPDWNVLLVETGGYPSSTTEVPGLFNTLFSTGEDYVYETQPQPEACLGLVNGVCSYIRGKVLGGCSSVNTMMYVRGVPQDYDDWGALGNEGWSYDDALYYFKKSENVTKADLRSSAAHGIDGYLTTSYDRSPQRIRDVILDAALDSGNEVLSDAAPIGYYECLTVTENGRRCSSSKAFISKIKTRSNLYLAVESTATKININQNTTVAESVSITYKNQSYTIKPKKEIILSAGTINNPPLLLASGVGPTEVLTTLNISIIKELPVGLNLQDHMLFMGLVVRLNDCADDPPYNDELYDYFAKFEGPLRGIGVTNVVGFRSTINESTPDVQYGHIFFPRNTPDTIASSGQFLSINNVTLKSMQEANKNHSLLQIVPIMIRPESRGNISMTSTGMPLINGNFLTEYSDVEILLRAIDYVNDFISTPSMTTCEAEIVDLEVPGCDSFDWECLIRHLSSDALHAAGTCKMGLVTDTTAVVDARLRMHGVKNLRVVDASIMPVIVRGNTNAPTIMIGEKGADMIKRDWGFNN